MMKRAYLDLPEGQMHYRYCGKGKAIVMVHMAAGSSEEFENVSKLLEGEFSIYAVDLFGYGFSDKPNGGGKKFTLIEHAQSLIHFMEGLNLDKVILYGTLVGANICARTALKCPEKIEALILAQPIYFENYEDVKAKRNEFPDIIPSDDGSHMLEIWKRSNYQKYPAEYTQWRAAAFVNAGLCAESMHQAMFSDEDYNILLPLIQTPTVVIAFEKYVMAPWMKNVAELIPNAKLDLCEDCNIYAEVVNPQVVADIIFKRFGRV